MTVADIDSPGQRNRGTTHRYRRAEISDRGQSVPTDPIQVRGLVPTRSRSAALNINTEQQHAKRHQTEIGR